jgi:hypothetical protein
MFTDVYNTCMNDVQMADQKLFKVAIWVWNHPRRWAPKDVGVIETQSTGAVTRRSTMNED